MVRTSTCRVVDNTLLRGVLAWGAIACGGWLLSATAAVGADGGPSFREDKVDESLKRQRFEIGRILSSGQQPAEGWAEFDRYFTDYALARWTLVKDIAGLHECRKQLRSEMYRAKGVAHDHLNELVLKSMTRLAGEDYHPAVRVNAMLAIGELNQVEPVVGATAKPLPEAFRVLVAAVESEKLPEAVRTAALVGLRNRAEAGVENSDSRQTLASAMLRLAAEEPSTPGGQWLVGRAVETLALLKSPGDGGNVFRAIVAVLGNQKLQLSTRSIAAESLGLLDYSRATGIDGSQAATSLVRFAADACADELARPKNDFSGLAVRRRLKQRLDATLSGLKAIVPLVAGARRTQLADVEKEIKALSDLLDDKQKAQENVKSSIAALAKKLDVWLER